jgi:hypothetical protein
MSVRCRAWSSNSSPPVTWFSRWDVIQAHTRATATAATQFLDTLQHRMPFPIRALQVDGGSEVAAEFEQACQQRGLHQFVLPPRSPNSTARSNAPTIPTPRSSTKSLLAGNEKAQSRAPALGKHLQHRASPPGPRLPDSASVSSPALIDLLRGVAVLMVLAVHHKSCRVRLDGVDLFVLSGFSDFGTAVLRNGG